MMEIYVRTMQPTGQEKDIPLQVNKFDTIAAVKAQIENKENIKLNHQRLFLYGKELENKCQLFQYLIVHKWIRRIWISYRIIILFQTSIVRILPNMHIFPTSVMQLFFKTMKDKIITLKIKTSETIYNVKFEVKKVQGKEGVPYIWQKFIFAGRELHDGYTLTDYNVHDSCKIYLIHRLYSESIHIQVNVKSTGKIITLKIDDPGETTVQDVKIMIKRFPSDQQTLMFNRRVLQDELLLTQYNIIHESILDLYVNSDTTEFPQQLTLNQVFLSNQVN